LSKYYTDTASLQVMTDRLAQGSVVFLLLSSFVGVPRVRFLQCILSNYKYCFLWSSNRAFKACSACGPVAVEGRKGRRTRCGIVAQRPALTLPRHWLFVTLWLLKKMWKIPFRISTVF